MGLYSGLPPSLHDPGPPSFATSSTESEIGTLNSSGFSSRHFLELSFLPPFSSTWLPLASTVFCRKDQPIGIAIPDNPFLTDRNFLGTGTFVQELQVTPPLHANIGLFLSNYELDTNSGNCDLRCFRIVDSQDQRKSLSRNLHTLYLDIVFRVKAISLEFNREVCILSICISDHDCYVNILYVRCNLNTWIADISEYNNRVLFHGYFSAMELVLYDTEYSKQSTFEGEYVIHTINRTCSAENILLRLMCDYDPPLLHVTRTSARFSLSRLPVYSHIVPFNSLGNVTRITHISHLLASSYGSCSLTEGTEIRPTGSPVSQEMRPSDALTLSVGVTPYKNQSQIPYKNQNQSRSVLPYKTTYPSHEPYTIVYCLALLILIETLFVHALRLFIEPERILSPRKQKNHLNQRIAELALWKIPCTNITVMVTQEQVDGLPAAVGSTLVAALPEQAADKLDEISPNSDVEDIFRTPKSNNSARRSVSSTPRSQRHLTMSPHMSPGEKLRLRLDRSSISSNGSCKIKPEIGSEVTKNKTVNKPKLKTIDGNGKFLLDTRKKQCGVLYLDKALNAGAEDTDSYLETLTKIISNDVASDDNKREWRLTKEEEGFVSVDSASPDLPAMTEDIQKKLSGSVRHIFDVGIIFLSATFTRLRNKTEYTRYMSHQKFGEKTVVAILCLGNPRTIALKSLSAKKVTHHVDLRPGALLVMTKNTPRLYEYSITKGEEDEPCLYLILEGIRDETDSESVRSSEASERTSVSDISFSDIDLISDTDAGTVHEFNLLPIPKIVITEEPEHTAEEEVTSKIKDHAADTLSSSEESKKIVLPAKIASRRYSNEHETTVVRAPESNQSVLRTVPQINQSVLLTQSLVTSVQHMPKACLEAELLRNGLPIPPPEQANMESMRSQLIVHICGQMSKPEAPKETSQNESNFYSAVERSLTSFSSQLTRLTEELAHVKVEVRGFSQDSNKMKQRTPKEHKEYGKFIESSRTAMTELDMKLENMQAMNEASSRNAALIEESIRRTKEDLQCWYNSAFYREDSDLIKRIHEKLSGNHRNEIPLSEEIYRFNDAEIQEKNSEVSDGPGPSKLSEDITEKERKETNPYEFHTQGQLTNVDLHWMDQSTDFTHNLKNREVGYYGDVPYSYGGITHNARPISEHSYLKALFDRVRKALPDIPVNSALVTRYKHAGSHLPAHSDDEPSIVLNSSIITVSLGHTRNLLFKPKIEHCNSNQTTLELNHGDIFVMTRESQKQYTHEVSRSNSESLENELRISITFRNLQAPPTSAMSNVIGLARTSQFGLGRSRSRGRGAPKPQPTTISTSRGRSKPPHPAQEVVGHHAVPPPALYAIGSNADNVSRRPPTINITSSVSPANPTSRPEPGPSQSRTTKTFVTVIITDSIMKRVPLDALGTNHELHMINRSRVAALADKGIRNKIINIRPDFIYVHLGVNNIINEETDPHSIFNDFREFELFVTTKLQRSRLIFSLPLPTDSAKERESIAKVHKLLSDYVIQIEGDTPFLKRTTLLNRNNNFWESDNNQRKQLFGRDGIHLNREGQEVIMQNLRRSIHEITKRINGGPRRRFN